MSVQIEKRSVIDPRVDMSTGFKRWVSVFSSNEISTMNISANNGANNNSCTFDLKIPDNRTCVIDRSSVKLYLPVTIVKTGSSQGADVIYNPAYEGFRARPIEQVMQSLKFNLAGGQFANYEPYMYVSALQCFEYDKSQKQTYPTFIDMGQTYNLMNGSAMSPFASRFTNPYEPTRRCQPVTINSNTATACNLSSTLIMNLFDYPPFSSMPDVIGLNAVPFGIVINWLPQITRMWSCDYTNHPNKSQTAFTITLGTPSLSYNVLSLPFGQEVPMSINFPYHEVVTQCVQTTASISSAATFTFTSPVQELTNAPARFYLWAKPSDSVVLANFTNATGTADFRAVINEIKVQFGNKTSYFAECTQADLFDITKNNGLIDKITYYDWVGSDAGYNVNGTAYPLAGSIFCADFTKDMGSITQPVTTGVAGKWNFKISGTFTNINPSSTTFDVMLAIVYDGIGTIQNRNSAYTTNIIMSDAREALSNPIDIPYHQLSMMHGGDARSFFKGLWSKVRPIVGTISEGLKKSKALSNLARSIPMTSSFAPMIESFGYGEGEGGMIAGEGKYLPKSGRYSRINRYRS